MNQMHVEMWVRSVFAVGFLDLVCSRLVMCPSPF